MLKISVAEAAAGVRSPSVRFRYTLRCGRSVRFRPAGQSRTDGRLPVRGLRFQLLLRLQGLFIKPVVVMKKEALKSDFCPFSRR